MTVSNALRGTGRLSEEARTKILEEAARVGYRPNKAAQVMGRGFFDTVTFLNSVNLERSNQFHGILLGLAAGLQRERCHLHLAYLTDEELSGTEALPLFLQEWNSDGIIINYTHDVPPAFLKQLTNCRIPYIWFNNKRRYDAVYARDQKAAEDAVATLAELGHRNILYVSHPVSHHYSVADRRRGYERGMAAAGGVPEFFVWPEERTAEKVQAACDAILARKRGRPTAILSYSDKLLDVFLSRAELKSLSVPGDLSLLGFSDAPPVSLMRGISVMVRPTRAMGEAAAEMFLQKRADLTQELVAVKKAYHLEDVGTLGPARP